MELSFILHNIPALRVIDRRQYYIRNNMTCTYAATVRVLTARRILLL